MRLVTIDTLWRHRQTSVLNQILEELEKIHGDIEDEIERREDHARSIGTMEDPYPHDHHDQLDDEHNHLPDP